MTEQAYCALCGVLFHRRPFYRSYCGAECRRANTRAAIRLHWEARRQAATTLDHGRQCGPLPPGGGRMMEMPKAAP